MYKLTEVIAGAACQIEMKLKQSLAEEEETKDKRE